MSRKSISNARLYDRDLAPLTEEEADNTHTYFLVVLAWVRARKGTDGMPLRPAHFGAIRELIAAATQQFFQPDDAPLAAPIPELMLRDKITGEVVYMTSGKPPTPRDEALHMLWTCKAALDQRADTIKDQARNDYRAGCGLRPKSEYQVWDELTSPPANDESRIARSSTPPAFSSLDLAVQRLRPRLKALIDALLADALTVADGQIVERKSNTNVQHRGDVHAERRGDVHVAPAGAPQQAEKQSLSVTEPVPPQSNPETSKPHAAPATPTIDEAPSHADAPPARPSSPPTHQRHKRLRHQHQPRPRTAA